MTRPRAALGAPALLVAAAALLASCSGTPPAVTPPVGATPTPPVVATQPPPLATPAPRATPSMPEVPSPRLDVGILIERPSFTLPAGDWLVRLPGGAVQERSGPLVFSSSSTTGTPLFVVQAGSFTARDKAETERQRLTARLGVDAVVKENAGRFALRVGAPAERKTAEAFLSRVRREASPDAFLVGAPQAGAMPALTLAEGTDRLELAGPVEIASRDRSPLPAGEGSYRGNLIVRPTGRGGVHVIDRVNLEDYLKGVVPGEMGPRIFDELEALKAQTVAARSYAVRRLGDFASEGYDLCATPRCQVYGGVTVEQPLTNRAIEETAGEVLLHGGEVADTLFTSTCGGRTENAAEVFPSYASLEVPYLSSVRCAGEGELALTTEAPFRKGMASPLALRGRALLSSLSRHGAAMADLAAARKALRERLGLSQTAGPKSLQPAAVYADFADASGVTERSLLVEDVELLHAPAKWPLEARQGYATLQRFQLSPAALPVDRALTVDEAAGLWASVLMRLGDLEEVEGRLVPAPRDPGTSASTTTTTDLHVKTATKGRVLLPLAEKPELFRGGPDSYTPQARLVFFAGDKVRIFVRGGKAVLVAAGIPPASGLYERESVWVHWTRRFTATELAAKLRERDPSRGVTNVEDLTVVSRGVSGRARKVRLATDKGPVELTGLEIRFSLALPETLFSCTVGRAGSEPIFTFYGRGWGHGVGLCQNGAFGMALAGRDYRQILAHYYSPATLGPLPERPD